jgi:hypothetical protein
MPSDEKLRVKTVKTSWAVRLQGHWYPDSYRDCLKRKPRATTGGKRTGPSVLPVLPRKALSEKKPIG